MIDALAAVFTAVAVPLREQFSGITVTGELSDAAAEFPCVQIEETGNLPTQQDSGSDSLYALVTYRIRIYSGLQEGRVKQAREILEAIDRILEPLNLRRKTYLSTSGLYNNSAYCIDTTYTGCIGADGKIYRR